MIRNFPGLDPLDLYSQTIPFTPSSSDDNSYQATTKADKLYHCMTTPNYQLLSIKLNDNTLVRLDFDSRTNYSSVKYSSIGSDTHDGRFSMVVFHDRNSNLKLLKELQYCSKARDDAHTVEDTCKDPTKKKAYARVVSNIFKTLKCSVYESLTDYLINITEEEALSQDIPYSDYVSVWKEDTQEGESKYSLEISASIFNNNFPDEHSCSYSSVVVTFNTIAVTDPPFENEVTAFTLNTKSCRNTTMLYVVVSIGSLFFAMLVTLVASSIVILCKRPATDENLVASDECTSLEPSESFSVSV